jgi:hypothetical protein
VTYQPERDDQRLIDAIRAAINDRGLDYVYNERTKIPGYEFETCVYSVNGGMTGSCVIGKALIDHIGVGYNPNWEGEGARQVLRELGPELFISAEVRRAAGAAQVSQDTSHPYETVLAKFNIALKAEGITT